MTRYLLKKGFTALLTLCVVVILTFIILRLTPGNVIDQMVRDFYRSGMRWEEAYDRVTKLINFDPRADIFQQFLSYVQGLLQGNLGQSLIHRSMTANDYIAAGLPWTLFVTTLALFGSFFIGVNLGTIMAWCRRSIVQPLLTGYVAMVSTLPPFIIAIPLIMLFGILLKWFPINGAYSVGVTPGFNLEFLLSALHHAVLPILTYLLVQTGEWIVRMKGSAVNVLGADYITAARLRGLSNQTVRKRYVKRNALLPVVTGVAISYASMLGGALIIENQFTYPGMGYYINQALAGRDYPVYQGMLLVVSLAVIVANLVADLLYAALDPRVKLEG